MFRFCLNNISLNKRS